MCAGGGKSNLTEIKIEGCQRLEEIGIDEFSSLKRFKVAKKCESLKNLFIRGLSKHFRGFWIDSVANLQSFECFMKTDIPCRAILDNYEDQFVFSFGGPIPALRYFKFAVDFETGYPNKVAMKWKRGQTPVYFKNQF